MRTRRAGTFVTVRLASQVITVRSTLMNVTAPPASMEASVRMALIVSGKQVQLILD